MYFDDIKVGMTMQIAPAIIVKEKMMDFTRNDPGVMSFMSVLAKHLEVDLKDISKNSPSGLL